MDTPLDAPVVRRLLQALDEGECIGVGTIDGLLAALCIRHEFTMLTADDDFRHMARHCDLRIWGPGL